MIILACHFGKRFSNFYIPRWRNFLIIFYAAGIAAVLAYAGYGTVIHDGGYVETIIEFIDVDRATGVAKIFFILLVTGWYGVYKDKLK
jgi:hypothetical protein